MCVWFLALTITWWKSWGKEDEITGSRKREGKHQSKRDTKELHCSWDATVLDSVVTGGISIAPSVQETHSSLCRMLSFLLGSG